MNYENLAVISILSHVDTHKHTLSSPIIMTVSHFVVKSIVSVYLTMNI